jgi:N-acetylglucosaminyldiphosphoundecaprenol N-acetyl-beta-D-mannosaminyltransferase
MEALAEKAVDRLHEVLVMDVRIHRLDLAGFYSTIVRVVESGQGGVVSNVNVHAMNIAWEDPLFRKILNQSDLVFVDGMGVKWGGQLIGEDLGERMTMADWGWGLFDICQQRGWPVFWLGDTDEVGEEFQRIIIARYPDLVFAGRHHGYFAKDGEESDAVVQRINDSGAKILLVGMSMPIQEKWLWAQRDRLKGLVCLNVGGAARIVTGHIRRGPSWMTQNGLEWLYRLAMQPRYTWRRYVIGNPLFLIRLLSWRFLGRSPRPLRETAPKH